MSFQCSFTSAVWVWFSLSLALFASTTGAFVAQASWYNTGLGACGQTSNDEQMVVALPFSIADSNCLRSITVKNPSYPNFPSVIATVVDKCMNCANMDLDVSPAVFKALNAGDLGAGRIHIEWNYN
ncbi:hypothetical protein K3495_g3208 [Podosphaera aphanis]|nr:hypothetical protein K3495_g3208 [Podosphaera aphanis]